MNRREMLLTAGATLLEYRPSRWAGFRPPIKRNKKFCTSPKVRALCIPKSIGRKPTGNSADRKNCSPSGAKQAGFEVVCSQDPAVFDGDLDQFDAIAFYTSGEPISVEQKTKLLDAVKAGKPFVGIHSATDTFRLPNGPDADPYIAMVGAEFIKHDAQQKAKNRLSIRNSPAWKASAIVSS